MYIHVPTYMSSSEEGVGGQCQGISRPLGKGVEMFFATELCVFWKGAAVLWLPSNSFVINLLSQASLYE